MGHPGEDYPLRPPGEKKMTELEQPKKAVKKITNIEECSQVRTIWHIKPESSVDVEDLLDPDYWAHVAKQVRAGDRIEAVPEDRHYFAEFFVLGSSTNWVKVVLLRKRDLVKDNNPIEKDGFVVKFAGQHKWRVEKDGQVLSKMHDDQASAAKWLSNHLKDMR